jgi:competence protein ComEC
MTDKLYSRPVIPLLLSMMPGIASGVWFPGHGTLAYIVVSVFACFIFYAIAKKKTVVFSPIVLFLAIGYISIQSWVVPDFPSQHVVRFADTHPWEIAGVIDTFPVKYPNRQKFILSIETLEGNKKSFPVTGKIRVTVSGNSLKLTRGDRVAFYSKIRSIRNFNNPGGFDYKRYMAFKKVWATAYVSEKRLTLLKKSTEKGIFGIIDDARSKISDFIEHTGAGKQQGVLKALIIGDRNSIPQDLREAFNKAGVGHILAISGLHIGIVATAAFLFFKWMLSHINLFLWNAWTKKGAVILSVVPVFVYGLLSGMSPSTQRAVIMVTVFLMAFLFESEYDPMNTLALAAMLILVVHPPSLFSISFQLSFTAVLSIIYGLSRVKNPWRSDSSRIKTISRFQIHKKMYYFFMASFFAIIGTLPLVMFYFNQISLVGFLANFMIVPLIGFVVVPLGLIAAFLYPLTVFVASGCLKASAVVLSQALGIVNFLADLPFAAVKTVTPTHFEICCFYLLLWAVLNLKRVQSKTPEGPNKVQKAQHRVPIVKRRMPWTIFLRKPATLVAVLVIFALSADACYWLYNRFWHDDLRVTMVDVGHGSAALLELPDGYNILIDGGGFSDNRVFDVGARIIAPLLWRKKIKTVDTLVLSHPNSDHLNGLIYIAEHFNVKNIWTNNEASKTFGYKKFMEVIEKNNIQMPGYKEIARFHDINGVCLEVLYPPVDFIDRKKIENWRNINNNSLVIKVVFGSKSFLFPGDIKARAEGELVATAGDRLKSTVMMAPHHGSLSSSTEPFLEKVNPEVVIISSRWKSRFGFPHPPVLKRYKGRGCRIFGTARHGAITMSTDGQALMINPTIKRSG